MRVSLEAGDRTLLMVAGFLLVGTTVAGFLLMPPEGESASSSIPSSYSTASDGAKAAFLLLDEMGYDVRRWTNPPDQLPGPARGTLLVLADPALPATGEERRQIEQFVRRGGRVLITGMGAATLLPSTDFKPVADPDFGWHDFPARLPGPVSQQATSISMKASHRWGSKYPDYVAYYGNDGGAVVAASRLGKGEIIWWAAASPLTNYGLTRSGNLKLFLNCVGNPKEIHVLWDEYFHGMRAGLWDYLGRTPIPWAVAQMGVLFLALILTYSRRSGPIAAPQGESRLSPLEFVETVGDLYERKRAAAGAVEVAFNRFRFLLERRLGMASPASFESLDRAMAARGGWPDLELRETIRKCPEAVKSGHVSDKQAMAIIQLFHDFTRRLRLGRVGG